MKVAEASWGCFYRRGLPIQRPWFRDVDEQGVDARYVNYTFQFFLPLINVSEEKTLNKMNTAHL